MLSAREISNLNTYNSVTQIHDWMRIKYKVIGSGIARTCYLLKCGKKVVKVANSEDEFSIEQMKNEYRTFLKASQYVPEIYAHGPKFRWMICEKVTALNAENFKQQTGEEYEVYSKFVKEKNKEFFLNGKNKDCLAPLSEKYIYKITVFLSKKCDVALMDMAHDLGENSKTHWGLNKNGKIVLIDPGITWDLQEKLFLNKKIEKLY